jgi:cell division protein FtsI/penicillin-binding protein 2
VVHIHTSDPAASSCPRTTGTGGIDDWMTAAAPINDPAIVVTSMVQGPGTGATSAGTVVQQALEYFFSHQNEITTAAPMQVTNR